MEKILPLGLLLFFSDISSIEKDIRPLLSFCLLLKRVTQIENISSNFDLEQL